MDSSLSIADDTIRDHMDSGYVATRPRFTRSRRTWNINLRNLTAEDVRALDVFAEQTVQRGALSFYFPNLLVNGSFEIPAAAGSGDLVQGWQASVTNGEAVYLSFPQDGLRGAIVLSVDGYILQPGVNVHAVVFAYDGVVVNPGEVYQLNFQCQNVGTVGAAATTLTQGILTYIYSDGSSDFQYGPLLPASIPAYQPQSCQFTVPNAPTGKTLLFVRAGVYSGLVNNGSAPVTLTATSLVTRIDSVGFALVSSPTQTYGRMAGSLPLASAVRFAANKLPKFSDLGFGDGVKVYGTTFALEEV